MPRNTRWRFKILTTTSPAEESPNWRLSMQSKVSNVVRRAVETAAQTEQAVHTEVALTNVAPIKHVVNVTMTHTCKECPAFGKKCHKCGNKNHFSSCCRSDVSQDKGCWRDRTQTHSRSPERHHWPSRGRCSRSRSRSWSRSSGESVACSTHSINWYNIDDINVSKTFHSIYRSRMVASRSNDTDPDGKTKIITKLRIKLPHRWVVDNLQVKVDDGAEAHILPLCSFRSMFPHTLDGDSFPLDGFLRGSRTTLECYSDGRLVNHGSITLKLKHYTNNSFQDHQFFVVETQHM